MYCQSVVLNQILANVWPLSGQKYLIKRLPVYHTPPHYVAVYKLPVLYIVLSLTLRNSCLSEAARKSTRQSALEHIKAIYSISTWFLNLDLVTGESALCWMWVPGKAPTVMGRDESLCQFTRDKKEDK